MTSVDNYQDDEFRYEATFSYTVENISQLKEPHLSPPVYVRLLPWRIIVTPNDRALGFFIQCNAENDSPTWFFNAIAELRLKCYKPDTPPFTHARIKHSFHSKKNGYGYSNFITWQELQDPDKYYIHNDSITLEVHVIADVPYGVFWDSKKHTGYVGLKNQGATCYMNSLLQTLYFTNQLRRAVYQIPTLTDDSTKSVCLSLQRVFYELQFGDRPVDTKKLTKSFGWETVDPFMQHDVQEFLRVLFENLESKMKDTCVEGTIPALFQGTMLSNIKCINVGYNSTRYESFYDIQLNVKDNKNIYESFQDYITSEILKGDNKYDTGILGLQDANKSIIFTSFPPILHLHLMRFQYDPITGSSVKYNGRFEFYEQINLDGYLVEKEKTPADYILHAVLVHSGDNHSGHYVVFINPKVNGNWFKFDDEIVSSCHKLEAIEQNYGGMDDDDISFYDKRSNAYMLVYIRSSELERVLNDISKHEISSDLYKRLKSECQIEEKRRKERNDAHLFVHIHVIREEFFKTHQKKLLFNLDKILQRHFKLRQTRTVDEMIKIFAKTFGVHKTCMRIWNMYNIQSQKFKYFDFQTEGGRTIDQFTSSKKPWIIFLEIAKSDGQYRPLPSFNPTTEVLLFLKYYDPRFKRLNYLGYSQQSLSTRLIDMIPEVNKLLGFDVETELTVFNECKEKKVNNLTETLENILYLHEENLQGHIFIFQKDHVDKKLEFPTVEDYFMDLAHRIEITFCDKCNTNESNIIIELSNRYNYDQMAQAVAERLNTDPQKLQFFSCFKSNKTAGNAIPYTFEGTIKDLISCGNEAVTKTLFYQRLSLSIHELDNKKEFKCIWVSHDLKEEKELVLYLNKNDNVKELLEEVSKIISFTENSHKKLRLLKVDNHKIIGIYKEDVPLEALEKTNGSSSGIAQNTQKMYRIEAIPPEDAQLAENEMLIPVAHFSKEINNSFGVPLLIKATHGEPYGALKQRIQKRLNVPDKEWENYKFAVISPGHSKEINDNTSIDLEVYRSWTDTQLPYFGLDHINKSRKSSLLNFSGKGIKIYN